MFDDELAQKFMRNGLAYSPFCLESHYPIDLVIFMLGTNDIKIQSNKTVEEIGIGMQLLIESALKSNKGKQGQLPKVLIIAPQAIISESLSPIFYEQTPIEKPLKLSGVYQKICEKAGVLFLDASCIQPSV